MFLAAVTFAACDKGGDDTPKPIELTGGTTTTQTVYADETQKSDGIKFNATAPWTATVSGVAMRSGSDVEWLTLNAYEGKAGEQTLTLTLLPNTTGLDRKAEIKISCGGTTITITVEQKGVTQSGEKPEPTSIYITAAGKITGGEIFSENTSTTLQWAMRSGNQEVLSPTSFPYVNKNFDITLPTPAADLLGAITDYSGLSITPSSAKFTYAVLYCQHTPHYRQLVLTNSTLENINNKNYRLKKGDGSVLFMYATTASTVSGMFTNDEGGRLETIKFNNCQFHQGWNEVMIIAEQDASANGSVTLSVTTNNVPSTFKWVCVTNNPEEPQPPVSYLRNERTGQTVFISSLATEPTGDTSIYLDFYSNEGIEKKVAMTLVLNKQNKSQLEGTYSYSTPQSTEGGVFTVYSSEIGSINGGTVVVEKREDDKYHISIDATETGGGKITGLYVGCLQDYPSTAGKGGSLNYTYNNATSNISDVVLEGNGLNQFYLRFYKSYNTARKTLAFDMNVYFRKDDYWIYLPVNNFLGTYSFKEFNNLTSGSFYLQKGEVGNALYYVHGGTIKITAADTGYKIEVDISTTTTGESGVNSAKIIGTYEGYITGITK